jgi:hypothetical protein
MNDNKINLRRARPKRRVDAAALLRYRALSGRKVVVGRLLPRTDVAMKSGGNTAA